MTKFAHSAAAAALLAGMASAQPPVVVIADESPLPRERVSFADLNLDTAAGQKRLVWRIRGASNRVCSDVGKMGIETLMYRNCFRTALQDGLQQMQQVVAVRHNPTALASAALIIRGN